ncbi:hypothetical protein Taro_016472 [Colocasia esculenta]|uniref:Uncharacterized protein n=1 Tax=Colocasia esculenta TaxID=4460 RepID=A0A843UWC6_COLES|nr:hypothetical protein [Colocasia esculenta]
MKDYDAIHGLDWLEEHYALVYSVNQLASTSVDVDCESAAISMDAYSESTARDVDVNLPDQLRAEITTSSEEIVRSDSEWE